MVGSYEQLTEFTNKNAGTSEWCRARKDGKPYFIKKFLKPVYPSEDLGLPEKKFNNAARRFHAALETKEKLYAALREHNASGTLALPVEVFNYQYHLCTVTEYLRGNIDAKDVPRLSPWQRLILMRTLTLALINVHASGVVHGDMKPDNLIITQNAETGACMLKLIDFDSCYFADNPPETADDIGGDMGFWAPEIVSKFTDPATFIDQRVDNFALGLVLHWLWLGDLPHVPQGKYYGQMTLTGEEIPLSPSLPPALHRIISGLMEIDPDMRLRLKDAYRMLGEMVSEYPQELVNLQSGRPAPEDDLAPEKPVVQEKSSTRKRSDDAPASSPTADTPGKVDVCCRDTSGALIKRRTVRIEPGETLTLSADAIDGYILVSSGKEIVRADSTGMPSTSTVIFRYRRKFFTTGRIIFASVAVLLLMVMLAYIIPAATGSNQVDLQLSIIPGTSSTNAILNWESAGPSDRIEYTVERRRTTTSQWSSRSTTSQTHYSDRLSSSDAGLTYEYRVTAKRGSRVMGQDTELYTVPFTSQTISNVNQTFGAVFYQSSKTLYYQFTAPSSGNYTFYSTGSYNVRASMYSNQLRTNLLNSSDDQGSNSNFHMTQYLSRNQTVYLTVTLQSSISSSASIRIGVSDKVDEYRSSTFSKSYSLSSGGDQVIAFRAPSTGYYCFYTSGATIDVDGRLYSDALLSSSKATDVDSGPVHIRQRLTQGEMVYLRVYPFSRSGSVQITVTRNCTSSH